MKRKLGGVVLATMIIGASLTGCITVTIPSDNKAVETEKTDNKNETLSKEVESTEIETEVAKEIEVTEAVGVVEETTEVVEETTEVVEDGGVNQYYKFAIDSPDDLIYHGEAILSGQRVYVFTDTTEENIDDTKVVFMASYTDLDITDLDLTEEVVDKLLDLAFSMYVEDDEIEYKTVNGYRFAFANDSSMAVSGTVVDEGVLVLLAANKNDGIESSISLVADITESVELNNKESENDKYISAELAELFGVETEVNKEKTEDIEESSKEIKQAVIEHKELEFKIDGFEFMPGKTTKEEFFSKFSQDDIMSMYKYSDGGINYTFGKDTTLSVDFSGDGTLEAVSIDYMANNYNSDFNFDAIPIDTNTTLKDIEDILGAKGTDELGLGIYDFYIIDGIEISVMVDEETGKILRIDIEEDPFY